MSEARAKFDAEDLMVIYRWYKATHEREHPGHKVWIHYRGFDDTALACLTCVGKRATVEFDEVGGEPRE